MIRVIIFAIAIGFLLTNQAVATPAVFWASDPVRPGEASIAVGEDLGDSLSVELAQLPDGPAGKPGGAKFIWPEHGMTRVDALQTNRQSLKFVVPPFFNLGQYALRISTPTGSVVQQLNRPQLWWAQGDGGVTASPGGWVRAFGKNLGWGMKDRLERAKLWLEGPRSVSLAVETDGSAARAELPQDLPAGNYRLYLHNGAGGTAGWSDPIALTIRQPDEWPNKLFNVKKFGALADGVKDDTTAIQNALAAAAANGGGQVFLPHGRYKVSDTLTIPRHTVLRGEREDWVALAWTDMTNPPEALLQGTNSFMIKDLTIYANQHQHIIVGDLGAKPNAGNVHLQHVRVRTDAYRGHLNLDEVNDRLKSSMRLSTGGGDTVRLGGNNIEITNCDFYGSGRALFLSRVRGGLVSDNRFYNGRWGWYCISGSDGLIFKRNLITGADLMSTGGGLNCLDGSSYSQNVYYANNQIHLIHGWDREAMTSDAGGEAFSGKPLAVNGLTLQLESKPEWKGMNWTGAAVFVLNGRGTGQVRRVANQDEYSVTVDRPWTVAPDKDSTIGITMYQGHYMIIGNEFIDCGPMQFFGTAVENVVLNNMGTRMSGFSGKGMWYHGYQPNWYCEYRDNEITEGNYYHWSSVADSVIEIVGLKHGQFPGSLNIGTVVRGNQLKNNAHIGIIGNTRDAIVEANSVSLSDQGIFVSKDATNILIRDNSFENVREKFTDEHAQRRKEAVQLRHFLNRREPIVIWDFKTITGNRILDTSSNGFHASMCNGITIVPNQIRGHVANFDGTGWLRIDDSAAFNAPDISLSLWIKPASLHGRRGLVVKRFQGVEAPFILTQNGASLGFEATDVEHHWSFNFKSPALLKKDEWTHVAVVAESGRSITLYANGRPVAEIKNMLARQNNDEPLIIGREQWGGSPSTTNTPGFFIGQMDEVKIWTRALKAAEIRADHAEEAPFK